MKTVNDLFAMQDVMTQSILNKTPFVFNDKQFTREEWVDDCEEQEGVRFCQECGELITEGYLIGGCDTYCSIGCVEGADAVTKEDMDAIRSDDEEL